MADIFHDFKVQASPSRVFAAISSPSGLDQWWTKTSAGRPRLGAEYDLGFGPGYGWRAKVTRCEPDAEFELELVDAHEDWLGTRVGFELAGDGDATTVRFRHTGWPQANAHYRQSSYCWAMYLRIMQRAVVHGESVPYEER